MTLARLLLPLVLASAALAQTTPAEPPEWEGQYTDTKVTLTLWARGEGAGGLLDVRGALYPVRAKVGRDGSISGTFQAGEQAFGFEGGIKDGALRLKSGGVSLLLRKRAPAQGAGEVNPLAAPPPPDKPKAAGGPD